MLAHIAKGRVGSQSEPVYEAVGGQSELSSSPVVGFLSLLSFLLLFSE